MEAEESPAAAAVATEAKNTKEEMEAEITKAMLSRLDDFKQQADNLTLEGVRRALEKDLGMERLSLDAHKKFIKHCLEKYFYGADEKNASEGERKITAEPAQSVKELLQPEEDPWSSNSDHNENLEGYPALEEQEQADHGTEKSHNSSEHGSKINEDMIKKAIKKRAPYFKSDLDNLTLEGVRRALEKDLGMERLSLDAHKKFIKHCLGKYFYGADEKNASEGERKITAEPAQPVKELLQPEEDPWSSNSDRNENLEGSPALEEQEHADHGTEKSHNSSEHGSKINEDMIKKAIKKRAPYFRSNLEITLGKVRRLLEEDLKLEKNSLDPFKKFISNELDAILEEEVAVQATNGAKKESKKASNKRVGGKSSKGAKRPTKDSDSSDSDVVSSDEEEEDIRKPKKRPAQKIKAVTKGSKRQKISAQNSKASGPGKKKPVEDDSEKSDGEKSSENDRSQSSGEEEEVKKKSEKSAQVYGKRVEHLKSIIKSCAMGVPPAVYKRVKQAPESKREAHLIKELEEILEKEGLSTDPSEKEIKEVKKRKERAKELEGIDMSNIVSSSRRRSTSSYIPPPKPKIEAETDEDEQGEEGDEDSEEGDDDGEDSSEGSDADDAEEESD